MCFLSVSVLGKRVSSGRAVMDLEQETSLLFDFIDDGSENINTEELRAYHWNRSTREKDSAMSQLW